MSELQTAEETQQYGQAGIEQAQGYEPLHPPSLPEDVGLDDRSAQIKAGVKEIVSRRSKPEEYTPPISVRAYSDQQGNRLTEDDQNPKETVTLAEAATDLATMRVREENQAELDEREALAREIDALRNGVTTVQLNAEPPPVVDQPQPVQPQLSPDEIVANKLRESPELLAAMQQSIANEQAKVAQAQHAYAAAVQYNATAATAHLLQNYPELAQLNDVNQLEGALRAIRASNPSRYAEITEGLARTRALVAESQRIQQVQQQQQVAQAQRAYANYRNNFNTWADEQDKQYEALALSVPEQERHAIEREARKMLNEAGFTDQQIAMEWHTSPSLRSYFGQRMLWQSARDRLNAHRAHAKRVKTAPHVQRPGSPLHFVPEADYQLRKMERPGKNLSVKEAADFVAARRQAGRRGR